MPRPSKPAAPDLSGLGIPDFRTGIAEWNAAYEAVFPALNLTVGNLEKVVAAIGLVSEEVTQSCPNYRMLTCDVTLGSLEANSGEGFLTLLRQYLRKGEVNTTESGCVSFWHPDWTKEVVERLQTAGHAPQVQLCMAQRDQFLTWFLYNTILSAIGTPRPPEIAVKSLGKGFDTTLDWGAIPRKVTKRTLNSENSGKGKVPPNAATAAMAAIVAALLGGTYSLDL
ncbi:hypothetical protein C8R46DRAFT_1043970 [Mycena filopes]|nr:hypothetical protein C8R46DRAFT_1043970 [Mycena filopes]